MPTFMDQKSRLCASGSVRVCLSVLLTMSALAPLSGCAASDVMSGTMASVSIAVDWGQTRCAFSERNRERNVERNPLLGPRPGGATVDGYFAVVAGLHAIILTVLPPRWRTAYAAPVAILQARTIYSNPWEFCR